MFRVLHSTVNLAHKYIAAILQEGGVAVDATVGNGGDTLFLARLVGKTGRVYGFDIQEEAINKARVLIAAEGYAGSVRLFQEAHENLSEYVREPVDAVIFNLGYLPGGSRDIVTRPLSTVSAVQQALAVLKPGGIVCIVVYTGHPGGPEEREELEKHIRELDKKWFCVGRLDFLNREKAPYLIVIEKSLNVGGNKS